MWYLLWSSITDDRMKTLSKFNTTLGVLRIYANLLSQSWADFGMQAGKRFVMHFTAAQSWILLTLSLFTDTYRNGTNVYADLISLIVALKVIIAK